jgi:hypothetical protein
LKHKLSTDYMRTSLVLQWFIYISSEMFVCAIAWNPRHNGNFLLYTQNWYFSTRTLDCPRS